jgi:hypothetical protein
LVRSNQRLVVVGQGFAHPRDFVVEQVLVPNQELVVGESDLVHPNQRLVVVEQVLVPNQELVVGEFDLVRSNQRLVVVEQASVDPILMVAAGHPMRWLVDRLGSRNLPLAYSPAGSSQEGEPAVVPVVANQKRLPRLPASFSCYYEIVVSQRLK